jgi:hypothetical protein
MKLSPDLLHGGLLDFQLGSQEFSDEAHFSSQSHSDILFSLSVVDDIDHHSNDEHYKKCIKKMMTIKSSVFPI